MLCEAYLQAGPVRGATRLQRRRQCAAGIENEQVTFAQEFGKLLELRMLHSAALPIDHKQPHFVATEATTFRRLCRHQWYTAVLPW